MKQLILLKISSRYEFRSHTFLKRYFSWHSVKNFPPNVMLFEYRFFAEVAGHFTSDKTELNPTQLVISYYVQLDKPYCPVEYCLNMSAKKDF